jgi:hypothetical protein
MAQPVRQWAVGGGREREPIEQALTRETPQPSEDAGLSQRPLTSRVRSSPGPS